MHISNGRCTPKRSQSTSSLGEIQRYVFIDRDLPSSSHPVFIRPAVYIFFFKLLHACVTLMNCAMPQMSTNIVCSSNFCFPSIIKFQFIVRLADPANNDAKMKLAEIYEIMGEPRKALDLVYEGM